MYRKTTDLTEKNMLVKQLILPLRLLSHSDLVMSAQSFTSSKFNPFSIVDGIRILVAQMIIEQIGEPI